MFALLPADGIPDGAIVIVGMDWGEHKLPTLSDLEALWPDFKVTTFPNVPYSNAIIATNRFITANDLALPARKAGARRVFVFRHEGAPWGEDETFAKKVEDDLKKAINLITSPFSGDNGAAPVSQAKTVAITLGIVAALAGGALLAIHFMGGAPKKRK